VSLDEVRKATGTKLLVDDGTLKAMRQ
jgi:hypothetical protein